MTNKKILVLGLLFTAVFSMALFWPEGEAEITEQVADAKLEVIMYKNEGCQCCTKWADRMNEEEFAVIEKPIPNLYEVKQEQGISRELASCHTALVDGYVVEGHVPVEDVQRLLKERPDAIGLTVPGMPIGSPGMEVEGREADKYDVLLIAKDGSTSVYASY
ncbi:MAG: DUF411 domain-containing protein [Balneolaceae bacterium]